MRSPQPLNEIAMHSRHKGVALTAVMLAAVLASPMASAQLSPIIRERQGRDRDWQDASEDTRRLRLAEEKRARKAAKRVKGR